MGTNRHYDGLECHQETIHGLEVSFTNITALAMARHLNSPMGQYVSIDTGRLGKLKDRNSAIECFAECLTRFLEPFRGQNLLVVGIGNADDFFGSLGPQVLRHIPAYLLSEAGASGMFKTVSLIAPGTNAQTNIDTDKLISGIAQTVGAACVLFINVSVTTSLEDVSSLISLSTGGLKLIGSGKLLTEEELGLPVVTVNAPLFLSIPPKTVNMLHIRVDKEGVCFADTNVTADIKCAVNVISNGILRTLYPELGLAELREIAEII